MDALVSLFGALTPHSLIYIATGAALGVVIGAIPGFTGGMLIALTIPVTFGMSPANAIGLLVAMYMGSVSGGLVSAILLRMPGTPASVVTTFDGYPMAKRGEGGRAVGVAASASLVGGVISWLILVLLAYPLSVVAIRFTPWDYFALTLLALGLITSVSGGSQLRSLLSAVAGLLLAMPGDDPSVGMPRLTFGFHNLDNGFSILPVFLGLFAISQVFGEIGRKDAGTVEQLTTRVHGAWVGLRDYLRHGSNMLRSSLIGTFVGLLPGVGANIGSLVSYAVARRFSRKPEQMGHGSEEGLVASEAANNATVGGALIPLVSLGIPGSVIDAILIGALILHGVSPGPMLFVNNPDVVYSILVSCLIAALLIYPLVIFCARPMIILSRLPRAYLMPAVLFFCIVGAYANSGKIYDVWVMLGFGVLGYLMEKGRIPLAPFTIGFVLAPIAESNLRTGLMISGGSMAPLWTNPMPLIMTLLSLLILVSPWLPLLKSLTTRSR